MISQKNGIMTISDDFKPIKAKHVKGKERWLRRYKRQGQKSKSPEGNFRRSVEAQESFRGALKDPRFSHYMRQWLGMQGLEPLKPHKHVKDML